MPAAMTKSAASPPKRAAAAKAPKIVETTEDGEVADSGSPATLRLKELVDRVVASTGAKKKDARDIIEATLTQLGLALQNGEMLNLPDFGKVRIAKAQGAAPGSAMTLKLRPVSKGIKTKPAERGLAEPADHS